jgi:hypothetical protein
MLGGNPGYFSEKISPKINFKPMNDFRKHFTDQFSSTSENTKTLQKFFNADFRGAIGEFS